MNDGTSATILDEVRCPRCSARVAPSAPGCGHCGLPLLAPRPPAPPAGKGAPSRPVRAWICAACTAGALAFLAFGRTPEADPPGPAELCAGNLEELYSALLRCADSGEPLPRTRGREFWGEVGAREHAFGALSCAASPLSYRGPAVAPSRIPCDAVLACDREGAHPGGVRVLFGDGSVRFVAWGTSDYFRAMRETLE